ncbi:Follistatin-related protein 5 [Portunus trituberculatus]|uniref:Follistatin-related protein 5 n=1 Tax=Portunus trituberculatus TaxID=210409 RepID=A0A5B7DVI0_PORTR|nr:Follistatin-related protein 5 [Portunus trituberculatus]
MEEEEKVAVGKSRRHRDATPYFDDESHRLWSSDAAELLEGETVDAHVIQHHDPCQAHFCERGRVCRLDHIGEPQCECQPFCSRHRKLVCGNDGRLYLNHCELHRAACFSGARIHIDRSRKCFRKGLMPITWDNTPSPATPAPHNREETLDLEPTQIRDDLTQDNLLLYHHARLMAENGRGSEREYLVSLMFSKFDTNNNGALDRTELTQVI